MGAGQRALGSDRRGGTMQHLTFARGEDPPADAPEVGEWIFVDAGKVRLRDPGRFEADLRRR